MRSLLYIEVNLMCLIILLVLSGQFRNVRAGGSSSQLVMSSIFISVELICLSDFAAGIIAGASFIGAHELLMAANSIYYLAISLSNMLWGLYVIYRTGNPLSRRHLLLYLTPFVFMCVIMAVNLFSGILFSIDAANIYHRGPGILIHWLVTSFYWIFALVFTVYRLRKEKSSLVRQELRPLLYFIIAPILCSLIQAVYYGLTCVQIGFTVSMVFIVQTWMRSQISNDELTGLNNRTEMTNYIENFIQRNDKSDFFVMMVDLNHFKKINDTYGHPVGDQAIIDTADALKQAVRTITQRLFLCRYGGDEFVIIGKLTPEIDLEAIPASLQASLDTVCREYNRPYTLECAAGYSSGPCRSHSDFSELMKQADAHMYVVKNKQAKKHR